MYLYVPLHTVDERAVHTSPALDEDVHRMLSLLSEVIGCISQLTKTQSET